MDEHHRDRTNQKSVITEDTIWLPPSYLNNKSPAVSAGPKKKGRNWGLAEKSGWDWFLFLWAFLSALGTIAIPFVIWNFTQQQAQLSITASERQHQTDLQIAQDQQRATTLQTYIDNIQDLLLNHNLLKSKPDDDVAILARARTLTALGGLDTDRKGRLLQFLYEAKLIGFEDSHSKIHGPIIDLSGADLSDATLSGATLSGATLSGADLLSADLENAHLDGAILVGAHLNFADLNGATLSGATLSGAIFIHADLTSTDLTSTDLNGAILSGAYLLGAVLNDAKLSRAYLYGTHYLTQQQLDQASSCKDATLPEGLTCHHNQ